LAKSRRRIRVWDSVGGAGAAAGVAEATGAAATAKFA